jgi:hypothetical protein
VNTKRMKNSKSTCEVTNLVNASGFGGKENGSSSTMSKWERCAVQAADTYLAEKDGLVSSLRLNQHDEERLCEETKNENRQVSDLIIAGREEKNVPDTPHPHEWPRRFRFASGPYIGIRRESGRPLPECT